MSAITPRFEPFDVVPYDVPHPQPYLVDLAVADDQLSRVVDHVSNVEYVRWIDRVAELHADALGYTRRRLIDGGIMWFVVRHEIDYLAEAWPGDELVLATWVRTMQRVKSWRDTLIIRPADGTLVCRAATLWVLVDLQSRRPARIDARMALRFDPLSPSSQRCTSH